MARGRVGRGAQSPQALAAWRGVPAAEKGTGLGSRVLPALATLCRKGELLVCVSLSGGTEDPSLVCVP